MVSFIESEVSELAKSTVAQIRASNKYRDNNTKQIPLRVNMNTASEVITQLDSVDSKQGYIVSLIRSDIYRKNNRVLKSDGIEIRSDNAAKYADFIESHTAEIRRSEPDAYFKVAELFVPNTPEYIIVAELLRTIDHDIVLESSNIDIDEF